MKGEPICHRSARLPRPRRLKGLTASANPVYERPTHGEPLAGSAAIVTLRDALPPRSRPLADPSQPAQRNLRGPARCPHERHSRRHPFPRRVGQRKAASAIGAPQCARSRNDGRRVGNKCGLAVVRQHVRLGSGNRRPLLFPGSPIASPRIRCAGNQLAGPASGSMLLPERREGDPPHLPTASSVLRWTAYCTLSAPSLCSTNAWRPTKTQIELPRQYGLDGSCARSKYSSNAWGSSGVIKI